MPSIRSHFFRWLMKFTSRMMASRSTIDEWRALASRGSQKPALVRGTALENVVVGDLCAEWLIPEKSDPERVILYFHGGGWILGWYNSHRRMVSILAKAAQGRAFAPDYRLAPEFPFPAALDDCVAAYHYLLRCSIPADHIVLAGDSAGGNLVLATLLALKQAGDPLPAAGVCLSPATDLSARGESYEANAKKEVILPANFVAACGQAYTSKCDVLDPLVSPILGDLHGLPPLLIQAGGDEILLSDATRFAEKARQSGVDVTLEIYPGMWHVWQILTPYLPEAKQALDSITRFIRDHT